MGQGQSLAALIAQGEHPRVIMDILEHALMSTTMAIYGPVMPSIQRAATAKLDGCSTTLAMQTSTLRMRKRARRRRTRGIDTLALVWQ